MEEFGSCIAIALKYYISQNVHQVSNGYSPPFEISSKWISGSMVHISDTILQQSQTLTVLKGMWTLLMVGDTL